MLGRLFYFCSNAAMQYRYPLQKITKSIAESDPLLLKTIYTFLPDPKSTLSGYIKRKKSYYFYPAYLSNMKLIFTFVTVLALQSCTHRKPVDLDAQKNNSFRNMKATLVAYPKSYLVIKVYDSEK